MSYDIICNTKLQFLLEILQAGIYYCRTFVFLLMKEAVVINDKKTISATRAINRYFFDIQNEINKILKSEHGQEDISMVEDEQKNQDNFDDCPF